MGVLKIILTILFVIIGLAISVIVLMQNGKRTGLSAGFGGAASSDSYWSKNRGRSSEAALEKATKILGVFFMIIAIVLNMGFFK